MYEPNLERVAEKMIADMLRVQAGEHVMVEVRGDALPFAERVALEVYKAGGTCTLFLNSDEMSYTELTEAAVDHLSRPAAAFIAAIESCHHLVQIGLSPSEPLRFRGLDPHREAAARQRQELIASACFQPGRKVLAMEFPTRYMAEAIRMPWNRFHELYWRATDVDYRTLAARVATLGERLETAREIHLMTPRGTDVRLQRGNRPIHRDDGFVRTFGNLPAGEVSFAPREESVSGRVIADYAFYEGQRINDIELAFENGVCTPLSAGSGYDLFLTNWDRASGDKNRVGELGIGLNEEVRVPLGFPSLDEKAFGLVHLTLGENRLLGGKNKSTLQWNMHLTRPTLVADDQLIIQNGAFIDL